MPKYSVYMKYALSLFIPGRSDRRPNPCCSEFVMMYRQEIILTAIILAALCIMAAACIL